MRLSLPFLLAAAILAALAPPVAAASPSNDSVANRIAVSSFPYVQTVDMSEATWDGSDPWCAGAYQSVWYSYTAVAEETLWVTVPDSEPSTRICILPDRIDAGTYRIVSPGETAPLILDADRTYYIMLGVLDNAPSATINLDRAPALFDLEVSLDRTVADRVSGAADVSGTLSCSSLAPADLFVTVVQGSKKPIEMSVGRHFDSCGPTPQNWTLSVVAGKAYVPGPATISITAGAGYFDGQYQLVDQDVLTANVRLGAR